MKHRVLFCLLIISVLACSVTSADDIKQKKSNLDKIEDKCKGKTKAEVKKILGQPDQIRDKRREFWLYQQNFTDNISGKTYTTLEIYFYHGKVHWLKWFE